MKAGKNHIPTIIMSSILIILALISLLPILLVVMNSFKTHQQIIENPLSFPLSFSFTNFVDVWKFAKFGEGFLNSFKLTGTAIIIGTIASSCMGYVLVGKKIKSYKIITLYFMLATTVPLQLFMLPLYSAFANLNLMGNPFALGVVIAGWSLPMPIFLMRTYFLKIPHTLEDAARIDGAGTLQIFVHIMLPIVSPGMVTVAVIIGLFSWNEYLLSSTLLQGDANFTATLKFLSLNGTFSQNLSVIMSGALMMIVPIIVIFILLQRKFIEGMASGAVKG